MELRELPPGGREVQVPPGFCPPAGLSLGSFPKAALSRREVRVGGWPASPPVDGNSRACFAALPALPILIRNWQWQQPLRQAAPAPGWVCRSCPLPLHPAFSWERRRRESGGALLPAGVAPLSLSLSLSLCLSLSFLSLSGFKSHYMGFCSFGTSSSFQICPESSGAVPGMLRTRSVDYRDCTNERIQAVLVSREGIRHLPLPLSSFTPVRPPAPQCPQERRPSDRPLSLAGYQGVKAGSTHSTKLGCPLWLPPASAPLQYFFCQHLPGGGVLWKLGGRGENQTAVEKRLRL